MRVHGSLLAVFAVSALGGGLLGPFSTAAAQPAPRPISPPADYDPQMLRVLADSFGGTEGQAAQRLDREAAQGRALAELGRRGVPSQAYYSGERLIVLVTTAEQARLVEGAGLTPRKARRDAADLKRIAAKVATSIGRDADQVQSFGPDLPTERVLVTVDPGADIGLRKRLASIGGVTVKTGAAGGLVPTAEVVPGQIMDLDPGTNCSLGFTGTTSDGNNVLLTAGHCVEDLPDILDRAGTHIGIGVESRFQTGSPSVDMGLVDIDDEDTGRGYVDTRKGTTVPVTGGSSAPVGSAICKAGNTTGWTCGKITNYGLTVNYSGSDGSVTPTSGLARATVCTEGGDSGGAYISGSSAQGMTSGGPTGTDCGFNRGDVGSYSFYQPVVDAAERYEVTLTTS
jgi:hypothetical protein